MTPDLTLLLDLPVETGLQRAHARSRAKGATEGEGGEHGDLPDRFEAEAVVFFERVRERYLAIAAAEPQRVRILEATLPPAALLDAAMDALQPWFESQQ